MTRINLDDVKDKLVELWEQEHLREDEIAAWLKNQGYVKKRGGQPFAPGYVRHAYYYRYRMAPKKEDTIEWIKQTLALPIGDKERVSAIRQVLGV